MTENTDSIVTLSAKILEDEPNITFDIEPDPKPDSDPDIDAIVYPLEAWPVWMRIPNISLDTAIRATNPDPHYTMEIYPSGNIVSWLWTSPIPGNRGNTLMGGHNRWKGENGQLFALDTLNVGDEMEIDYEDGTSLTFCLESVFVYALDTSPVEWILMPGGEARITIITCKGPFNRSTGTSDYRIVAIFKEASTFVFPDPPITPFPTKMPKQPGT